MLDSLFIPDEAHDTIAPGLDGLQEVTLSTDVDTPNSAAPADVLKTRITAPVDAVIKADPHKPVPVAITEQERGATAEDGSIGTAPLLALGHLSSQTSGGSHLEREAYQLKHDMKQLQQKLDAAVAKSQRLQKHAEEVEAREARLKEELQAAHAAAARAVMLPQQAKVPESPRLHSPSSNSGATADTVERLQRRLDRAEAALEAERAEVARLQHHLATGKPAVSREAHETETQLRQLLKESESKVGKMALTAAEAGWRIQQLEEQLEKATKQQQWQQPQPQQQQPPQKQQHKAALPSGPNASAPALWQECERLRKEVAALRAAAEAAQLRVKAADDKAAAAEGVALDAKRMCDAAGETMSKLVDENEELVEKVNRQSALIQALDAEAARLQQQLLQQAGMSAVLKSTSSTLQPTLSLPLPLQSAASPPLQGAYSLQYEYPPDTTAGALQGAYSLQYEYPSDTTGGPALQTTYSMQFGYPSGSTLTTGYPSTATTTAQPPGADSAAGAGGDGSGGGGSSGRLPRSKSSFMATSAFCQPPAQLAQAQAFLDATQSQPVPDTAKPQTFLDASKGGWPHSVPASHGSQSLLTTLTPDLAAATSIQHSGILSPQISDSELQLVALAEEVRKLEDEITHERAARQEASQHLEQVLGNNVVAASVALDVVSPVKLLRDGRTGSMSLPDFSLSPPPEPRSDQLHHVSSVGGGTAGRLGFTQADLEVTAAEILERVASAQEAGGGWRLKGLDDTQLQILVLAEEVRRLDAELEREKAVSAAIRSRIQQQQSQQLSPQAPQHSPPASQQASSPYPSPRPPAPPHLLPHPSQALAPSPQLSPQPHHPQHQQQPLPSPQQPTSALSSPMQHSHQVSSELQGLLDRNRRSASCSPDHTSTARAPPSVSPPNLVPPDLQTAFAEHAALASANGGPPAAAGPGRPPLLMPASPLSPVVFSDPPPPSTARRLELNVPSTGSAGEAARSSIGSCSSIGAGSLTEGLGPGPGGGDAAPLPPVASSVTVVGGGSGGAQVGGGGRPEDAHEQGDVRGSATGNAAVWKVDNFTGGSAFAAAGSRVFSGEDLGLPPALAVPLVTAAAQPVVPLPIMQGHHGQLRQLKIVQGHNSDPGQELPTAVALRQHAPGRPLQHTQSAFMPGEEYVRPVGEQQGGQAVRRSRGWWGWLTGVDMLP